MPVSSCHFRGCKAPLSRIVSGAISSELPLPLPLLVTLSYLSLTPILGSDAFERILVAPAHSAPDSSRASFFSKSGLIVRPHRAKMSDKLSEALVFAKCSLA